MRLMMVSCFKLVNDMKKAGHAAPRKGRRVCAVSRSRDRQSPVAFAPSAPARAERAAMATLRITSQMFFLVFIMTDVCF